MIDEVLTMIPGPTPVHDSILRALALPTTSHVTPGFRRIYRECLNDVQAIARSSAGRPVVVAGSGTLAMEMALVNLVESGQRLLVVSQGYFGDRWEQLAAAFGIECHVLRAEWGSVVAPEDVERALAGGGYSAVAMTHVDTSTGAAAPVGDYCALLRGRAELSILDGVCATGGMDERFDDWGLDVLLTGAQKALGAPPGVAILVVSERALEARRRRESVPAYSADLLRWMPIMDDPGKYFSTPPVNEIVALRAATAMVLDEGLERRFARHSRQAAAVRAGLAALGLVPFTRDDCLADTLSVPRYPAGIEDSAFRAAMAERGVIVAGALGPIAGTAFRVGHMGNIGTAEVCRTLEAVETSLIRLGHAVEPGSALAAASKLLSREDEVRPIRD